MFRPSIAASYKPAHGGYPGEVPGARVTASEIRRKRAEGPNLVFAPPGGYGDGACGMCLLRIGGEESPYAQTTEKQA
jgi:hypothetical protein